ncbi:hypothetical protein CRE_23545 [Caenorhabditis remanei]|uniref:Acyltransferase 3 domain-containing protein n=1 Tax=Caenorhabditis remanei TaxID=31234 RepID=E3MHA7_CAERE|nr:hypothetical protein CRE_23545 [Caenorhabditis remanei]
METPQKRADLQGIRGIAIISVLAFHFFPKWCPNGYLGVDQFFVLSGFLMCMLLQKSDQHNPSSLFTQFYSKRLKRILPLYLFVIFWAMISLYSVFPSTSEKINQNSASHALIFMSNRGKTKEEGYFQMLSIALDIFTHTWSLSVEIQFYLIIPLIYLIGSKFSVKIKYLFYISIACISYTFSAISTPTVSFNSVFARIWQFLTGFLIYMLSNPLCQYKIIPQNDENDEKECQKLLENKNIQNYQKCSVIILSLSFFLTFGLIFIVFMPIPLDSQFLRPLTTITTGMLIIFSKNDQKILTNRVLTYFGDVSYALYLVHWPMYAFWKLTEDGDEIALVLTLLASIILSIIIHETYEKWYLQQSTAIIGMLTVILYILNVILVNKNEIIDRLERSSQRYGILDNVTDEMTMSDAAHLNHIWSVNDYANLNTPYCEYESGGPLGWCRHKGLSGKYKAMSIGNSWAANHAAIFHEECGHIAKSIPLRYRYSTPDHYSSPNFL